MIRVRDQIRFIGESKPNDLGFVVEIRKRDEGEDWYFCRFWTQNSFAYRGLPAKIRAELPADRIEPPIELRTKLNGEACLERDLEAFDSVSPGRIDAICDAMGWAREDG